jgi:hypothetical protein
MPKSVTHVLGKSVTYVPGRTNKLDEHRRRDLDQYGSLGAVWVQYVKHLSANPIAQNELERIRSEAADRPYKLWRQTFRY